MEITVGTLVRLTPQYAIRDLWGLPGRVVSVQEDTCTVEVSDVDIRIGVSIQEIQVLTTDDKLELDRQRKAIRQSVKRGAAWLDAEFPGWTRRVDITALNNNDLRTCILAQSTGMRWNKAVVTLFNDNEEKAARLGFFPLPDVHPNLWQQTIDRAWFDVLIHERKNRKRKTLDKHG